MLDSSYLATHRFDLLYFATHPLAALIYRRHAELLDLASGLAEGSEERKTLEKRISALEHYRLPKPSPQEQKTSAIVDDSGAVIAQVGSPRRRLITVRRGRPEEFRIKVRAALEEKIIHPKRTWRELSQQLGFNNYKDLERQVRLLKRVLKQEGIPIPSSSDYQDAQRAFDRGLARLRSAVPPE